jgi:hypothetical protein
MKRITDNPPIACSLTSAEFRVREATLLARFKSLILETEELDEGYAFHLPGNRESVALIEELIAAERECCPFLSFEVTGLPNRGRVIVRVSGLGSAKDFVKLIFCERKASNECE